MNKKRNAKPSVGQADRMSGSENRNRMNQISLKKRVQKIKSQRPDFLGIFDVYVEDYYTALASLSGNDYFKKVYLKGIRCIEKEETDFSLTMSEFLEMLHNLYLPEEQREKILYQMLIEPFIRIKEFRKE